MTKKLNYLFFLLLLLGNLIGIQAQCNGYTKLCDKAYNEVCYVTTHNAFNYEGDFILPNQNFPISQQLEDGVRGLMLDVYELNDSIVVYHSLELLGTQPLLTVLQEVGDFLDTHPKEVVTIILECYVSAEAIDSIFTLAELKPYLYEQTLGEEWKSLQEMIDSNKRLVLFSDRNDATEEMPYYLYVWDFAVETHFSNKTRTDFSCNFNRGNADNDLFIINHFITERLAGTGLKDTAILINSNPYCINRMLECQEETGKFPNFLTVDFYELGDVFETVAELNGVTDEVIGIEEITRSEVLVNMYPNPTQEECTVTLNPNQQGFNEVITLNIFTTNGQLIHQEQLHLLNGLTKTISTKDWKSGLYYVQLVSKNNMEARVLVVE